MLNSINKSILYFSPEEGGKGGESKSLLIQQSEVKEKAAEKEDGRESRVVFPARHLPIALMTTAVFFSVESVEIRSHVPPCS